MRNYLLKAMFVLASILFPFFSCSGEPEQADKKYINLPDPKYKSDVSVEEAILQRRSIRRYSDEKLNLAEAGQLLWAAQGITKDNFYRTVPSAGALYPLELYLVAGNVDGLEPGVYKYVPQGHKIFRVKAGDARKELADAALGQVMLENAALTIVITAVYERVTKKYGERGMMYVQEEAGHAGQNISLQVISLGCGTVPIGAFYPEKVQKIINAENNEIPIYIFPVGKR